MSISGVRFPMPLVKRQFWFSPRYFNGRKLLLHGRGSLFESGSRDFYGAVAQWSTALVLHTSIYRGFESHQLQRCIFTRSLPSKNTVAIRSDTEYGFDLAFQEGGNKISRSMGLGRFGISPLLHRGIKAVRCCLCPLQ